MVAGTLDATYSSVQSWALVQWNGPPSLVDDFASEYGTLSPGGSSEVIAHRNHGC